MSVVVETGPDTYDTGGLVRGWEYRRGRCLVRIVVSL